jgi:hypothetical protein
MSPPPTPSRNLAELMRSQRSTCTHEPRSRRIVNDPLDSKEFLFFCINCGMMATMKQVLGGDPPEPRIPETDHS